MRPIVIAAVLLFLAPSAARGQALVVEGRGWGHGVGLSQWGAQGFAAREGRDHRWILGHYYAGTSVGKARAARMRVVLKHSSAPKVCGATLARDASGRRITLRPGSQYRFRASGADRLRVTGRRARLLAPVIVTGGSSTCLRGSAQNGLSDGFYRGRMVLERDGSAVLAVNHVSLEHYLYGVVPAEMPADWAAEALRAQAIVARSYALRSRRPEAVFDVYPDVRSQVYRGVLEEAPAATAAVRATRASVVYSGADIAQTFFFSTSGGRTASNEDVWGGLPIPYLRGVKDPHDDLSPYHTWEVRFSEREARRRLREFSAGTLKGLRVASRTPSGRVATVEVLGTNGAREVSGATIQAELELRSTWFSLNAGPEGRVQ
jgi:stage II sporulation protein D